MTGRPHRKITPNRLRTFRREARQLWAAYVTARRAALESGRQRRAGLCGWNAHDAALDAALTARDHAYDAAAKADGWAAHVEVGSAWSGRGLDNVRRANRKDSV